MGRRRQQGHYRALADSDAGDRENGARAADFHGGVLHRRRQTPGAAGVRRSRDRRRPGGLLPLNRAEDYYLRAAANVAFAGKAAVPAARAEELALCGVDRLLPQLAQTLRADEIDRVAFIYSRGGRFADHDSGRRDGSVGNRWEKPLQIWNAEVAKHRHAITGERFSGCPTCYPARLSDGRAVEELYPERQWPLRLMSFKSNVMSSSTAVIRRLHDVKPVNWWP